MGIGRRELPWDDIAGDAHALEGLPLVPLALLRSSLGLGRLELCRVCNLVGSFCLCLRADISNAQTYTLSSQSGLHSSMRPG
jgi:hypothetical protein